MTLTSLLGRVHTLSAGTGVKRSAQSFLYLLNRVLTNPLDSYGNDTSLSPANSSQISCEDEAWSRRHRLRCILKLMDNRLLAMGTRSGVMDDVSTIGALVVARMKVTFHGSTGSSSFGCSVILNSYLLMFSYRRALSRLCTTVQNGRIDPAGCPVGRWKRYVDQ